MKRDKMKGKSKSNITRLILVMVLAVFVEIFICNYQHFFSSDINHRKVSFDELIYSTEYYEMQDDTGKNIAAFFSESGSGSGVYLPLANKINNIALYAYGKGAKVMLENNKGEGVCELDSASLELIIYGYKEDTDSLETIYSGVLSCKDESVIYNIPDWKVYDGIYLQFDTIEDMYVVLEDIEINLIPTIQFNIIRFVIILFLISLIVYRKEVGDILNCGISFRFVLGISIICGLLFAGITFLNPITRTENVTIDSYNDLARALLDGKVTVYDEYSYSLDDLDNLYNYPARLESGRFYITDFAYYKGHYYVYFGIVPCILLYLPYVFITGRNIVNAIPMAIIIMFLCVGTGCFIYELIKRYFEESTKADFVLVYILVLLMAQIPGMTSFPLVYQIAQCSGLAFITFGLALYVRAGSIKCIYKERHLIFAGSLLTALAFGCRPQLGIIGLLAFPLLRRKMLDKSSDKRKNVLQLWGAFVIPFVIVAIPLMIYNYVRFDSIFEFGSRYNLTDDNILVTTIYGKKIIAGFRYLFLELPHISNRFPFIDLYTPEYDIDRLIKGTTGGLFMLNVIALISFIPVKGKSECRKELLIAQYLLLALSMLIGVLDVCHSGCLERYKFDLGIWIGFSTAIVCLGVMNKCKARWIRYILLCCVILSMMTNSALFYYSDALPLLDYDKALYQFISRSIMFWT